MKKKSSQHISYGKIKTMKAKPLILFIIVCALLFSGCGNKDEKEDRKVIFTTGFEENELFFIEDSKCYLPEAKLYINNTAKGYESVYGDDFMDRSIGGTAVSDKLSSLALSRLAEVKAIGLLAAERGITLDSTETEKCAQAADRYMKSLTEKDVNELGITDDLLLKMYEDYALANKVYADITSGIDPEISDDEARIITIQRILIKNENESEAMQTANSIYAMISDGMSFDSLADDYNEDTQSKYSFGKDTDEFSSEFVNACFELSTDEISAPIVSKEGVSIVKCVSSYDMEQTDAHKVRMVERSRQEAFESVYSAFVKELYTGFNKELWDGQNMTSEELDSDANFFAVYDDVFITIGGAK